MALSAEPDERERQPIQFSVGLQKEVVKELEKLVDKSETPSLELLLQVLLVAGLMALVEKLSDATEREKMDALLRAAKVELHIMERGGEILAGNETDERHPTLDELMAMPPEERAPYLERAATLLEDEYRNNPELTITADATELYDYPGH